MKKLLMILLIILPMNANASMGYNCGIKPIPPIGCTFEQTVCSCDSQRNCQWIFLNC